MTKGLPRSLSRANPQAAATQKIRLQVNEAMSFTGIASGAIMATANLSGLPEGNILLLGIVSNLTFTGPTSANLADDFQGDYGIGTTPADDATISAADVDLIGSTAIPAATAEVSASVRATNATQAIIDNTAATAEMNLNVLLDTTEVADGEVVIITVTGTVDFVYSVLGDD